MRPRRSVELLPTISEMQEGERQAGDPQLPAHSMEEYLDSIKELSQAACYPLHGPLRGHRRWVPRHALPAAAPSPVHQSCAACAPWPPVGPSHVFLAATVARRPDRSPRDPLDWLLAQSQFAGLT